ncbi:hypothetical protein THAOC_06471, partial [Thalassiosira oceanica]
MPGQPFLHRQTLFVEPPRLNYPHTRGGRGGRFPRGDFLGQPQAPDWGPSLSLALAPGLGARVSVLRGPATLLFSGPWGPSPLAGWPVPAPHTQ